MVLPGLELQIRFETGEDLWTEISSKFEPELLRNELWDAGFVTHSTYFDQQHQFMLTLARPWG